MRLRGKTVLIGVTGGIAAYKVCYVVSALKKEGAEVHVVMTENATKFVTPITFETLSGNRVVTDTFDRNFTFEVEHVSLAKRADIALIAPATADVIGKLASGVSDDFLTTTFTALTCKVPYAPAMNTAMLNNKSTVDNMRTVESRGFKRISSKSGLLACGDVGDGRMAEPNEIVEAIMEELCPKQDFLGKTVLVTAGATRANIDPVRFLTNRSSGKMGYAIARAAYNRGANVVFVRGETSFNDKMPADWLVQKCETTRDMCDAVLANVNACDYVIMAAAPCDYEFDAKSSKIKSDTLTLELKKTVDIAKEVGKIKGKKKLVIFAAETDNCEENARGKLIAKNADMVVLNDVTKAGAGFDVDTNIVTVITKSNAREYDVMTKAEVADKLLSAIVELK